ncbi:MAG: phosphoribosylformylglycinamidine cyclo-ligase [Pirellulaceae bacterium]
MAKATYKSAGVDLDIYQQSMARLPNLMARTFSPRTMRLDGGFAGLFQLDFSSSLFRRNYQDPVLVACTDGVGTKLKVATRLGVHHTVGIDLVAMSVNDAICCGAEPLFFLDYVAMSKDDPDQLEQIVQGISDGCVLADCSLLGGETAIMPDMYADGDYDLGGFCVGVVEKKRLVTGAAISSGDVVLGIASSGLHSNGYSLARKVVFEIAKLDASDHVDQLGCTVGQALLEPTRIYVPCLAKIQHHYQKTNVLHGLAHITGGGLAENLERILPKNVDVQVAADSWPVPPVFSWLQQLGEIEDAEMRRVFNMGLGFAIVTNQRFAATITKIIQDCGFACFEVGRVTDGTGRVLVA